MSNPNPLIIAFTSGKGGVGKTMLAVACAYELSRAKRTLVVDLDFFNRGLSGLFRQPLAPKPGIESPRQIERPPFLQSGPAEPPSTGSAVEPEPWEIWQIAPHLFHIHYPDTSNREDDALEGGADIARRERIVAKSRQLETWLLALATEGGFETIVLDCHGGPDPMSFAAALVADYTILVSEPDRITLHGTLNFLRKLWRVCGSEAPDIRLVFNKVVPEIRVPFLRRFYEANLRKEFFGEDLLAIFPLEIYLTKAFEAAPIISALYPYSLLARKMQVLLRDLLGVSNASFLSRSAASLPSLVANYRRRTSGKIPILLDHNFFLGLLSIVAVVVIFFSAIAVQIRGERFDEGRALTTASIVLILSDPQVFSVDSSVITLTPKAVAELAAAKTALTNYIRGQINASELSDYAMQGYVGSVRRIFPALSFWNWDQWERSEPLLFVTDDMFVALPSVVQSLQQRTSTIPPEFILDWNSALNVLSKPIPIWKVLLFRVVVWWKTYYQEVSVWAAFAIGIVFILFWTRWLERQTTLAARRHDRTTAIVYTVVTAVLWCVVLYGFGSWVPYIGQKIGMTMFHPDLIAQRGGWIFFPATLLWLFAVGNTCYLAYRLLRHEKQPLEATLRIAFLIYLIVGGAVAIRAPSPLEG